MASVAVAQRSANPALKISKFTADTTQPTLDHYDLNLNTGEWSCQAFACPLCYVCVCSHACVRAWVRASARECACVCMYMHVYV